VWVRHLRVLTERPQPGREVSTAAVVERVEKCTACVGRLRLGRIRERGLDRPQQEIGDASGGNRSRGGLQLGRSELLLWEPGRRVAFIDDNAVVLRGIPGRHVRQLIDGAACRVELFAVVARGEMLAVDAPGIVPARDHQRV
jgi:hypothetical protein